MNRSLIARGTLFSVFALVFLGYNQGATAQSLTINTPTPGATIPSAGPVTVNSTVSYYTAATYTTSLTIQNFSTSGAISTVTGPNVTVAANTPVNFDITIPSASMPAGTPGQTIVVIVKVTGGPNGPVSVMRYYSY